ncbi:efflux RND transporter periplasmic adaptor subunit [Brevundimonas sp.]|uniref:efflux RND transporter periplasmic adaptor subunit n=1 Tax=Brevundimonas sp. TaxID=1871086 RepID=UPI0028A10102|nr:efflux RND transporter periplasmic adaptor subunit [Brevundimonas sp.]
MRGLKIAAVSVLATGALFGCSPKAEQQAPGAPPVTVATPLQQKVVDWDEFTGRFEAVESVDVRARVGGYIQAVHFRDGQMVQKGQLLFTLDPRPAQAALAQAQAQVAQMQSQLTLARANLARSETLLASQAVSKAEYDANKAAVDAAQANLAAANAAVRTARLNLDYTRVTAPTSGRVSDRRVDPGNLVAGGSSAGDILTTIISGGPIHFVFDGSEAVLLKYLRDGGASQGAPVRIRLQDESSYVHTGRLDFSDNAVNTASGVIRLRAIVPNGDGFLRPGMFGRAQVAGAAAYDALLVPDSAIGTDQARRVVSVVAADGSVTTKPVVLGPIVQGLRVIKSGLAPTDRIIIAGLQRTAQPGVKVKAQNGRITPVAGQASDAPVTQAAPASSASFANSLSSGD